jgi:hypothetical protein
MGPELAFILLNTHYLRKTHHKRAGGVAQGVCHEFKPQYHKNKNTKLKHIYKTLRGNSRPPWAIPLST